MVTGIRGLERRVELGELDSVKCNEGGRLV